MANKLTKQAAHNAGAIFDKAAEEVEKLASLGVINPDIARKFAYQCDLLADHTAKKAGISIQSLAKQALTGDDVFDEGANIGEDPEQIGEEKPGPHEKEGDEPYMSGHFSQQENRELREKQQGGELPSGSPERQTPTPGRQAAALEAGQKLASLFLNLNKAAAKCASSEHASVKRLGEKLASAGLDLLQFQTRLMEGSENIERVAAVERAAGHFLPHVAGEVSPIAADKLARMAEVFSGFAAPKAH